jgi:hypothetical protein
VALLSSRTDDFTALTLWSQFTAGDVSVPLGRALFVTTAGSHGMGGPDASGVNTFDSVQFEWIPDPANTARTYNFYTESDVTAIGVSLRKTGTTLEFFRYDGGGETTVATVTFSATAHRWMKVEVTGGNWVASASATGTAGSFSPVSGMSVSTATVGWDGTTPGCNNGFYVDTTTAGAGGAPFEIDNFNIVMPTGPYQVQDIGNQVSNAAATTTVVTFTGPTKPAVGDLVVMYGARDNITNDPATGDSFSDGEGNTYSRVALAQPAGTSTALAGVVGVFFYSILTSAWTGDQTLTWTHPSTKAAMRMQHWTNVSALRASGTNSAGSSAGAPSVALTTPVAGDLVLAMEAIEHSTASTSTGDSDTTNGTWSAYDGPTATTGTTLAAVKVISQDKVVTGTGTQTYNPTHSVTTNVDCVVIIAAFAPPVAGGPVALDGTINVTTTNTATTVDRHPPLTATVATATTSAATTPAVARPLVGTIATATTTTGAATGDLFPIARALAGVVNTTTTAVGNLGGPVALVGNTIAATTTTNNATQLAVAKALVGNTIAASTAATGALITALDLIGSVIETTTIAGTNLVATQALAGTINATTTDTATLTATIALTGTVAVTTTTTATTIGASVPLTGTIAATTATPAAALGKTIPLTGTVAVTTATTAAPTVAQALTGTIATATTSTATLGATRALTGTVAATTTTTGTANLFRPLTGTIAATTTTTGTTFAGAVSLVGNAIAARVATPSPNVGIALALTDLAAVPADWDSATTDWDDNAIYWDSGQLVPTLNPYTRVNGNLVVTGPTDLIGSIVATTSFAGNAAIGEALVGTIATATTLTMTGQLSVARALAGTIAATTTATGTRPDLGLGLTATLNATSTLVSGQPTVTWALAAAVNVATTATGTLTGATGFAASLATTTVVPAATLTATLGLTGTIAVTTAYTGSAVKASALVGTIANLVAPQTATIDAGRGLVATVAVATTTTATLGVTQAYTATTAATTTIAGSLVLGGPGSLDGTTRVATTMTGLLVVTRALTGTISAATTLPTAALPVDRPLQAAINATLGLSAPTIGIDQRLSGTMNAAVLLGAAVLLTGTPQTLQGAVTWDVVEGDIDYDVITQTNAIAEVIYT